MEAELRAHLQACAAAFAEAKGLELVTVGRLAAGDWRFFGRVGDQTVTFTARKYDAVMRWFDKHWPDGIDWPSDVPRPQREAA